MYDILSLKFYTLFAISILLLSIRMFLEWIFVDFVIWIKFNATRYYLMERNNKMKLGSISSLKVPEGRKFNL